MADAVISRGGTSVTLPLLQDGVSLTTARDVGKPTADLKETGSENPRITDHMNASDSFTVVGILHGANAYSDAKTLAEDLIKPRGTTGTPLQLDLSSLPSRSTYDVAPATSSALTATYVPGRRDMVGIDLRLTVVGNTEGGTQSSSGSTSPDSGTGIKLDRNGTSVTLSKDLEVVRKVGRPNGELLPQPDTHPDWIDYNKPAHDVFEISGELVSSTAEADAQTLEEDIIRKRLGTDTLTLHFLDGLYGLDAYDVTPEGSQAVRTIRRTGETGVAAVPTLSLRATTS